MTATIPFPYEDFSRVERILEEAIVRQVEDYILVTAETGTGKTSLIHTIVTRLDRCKFRVIFLHCDRKLGASGLIRVVARSLRLSLHQSSVETIQLIAQRLAEEPQRTVLILDNAQELPEETLYAARSLAESQLNMRSCLTLILIGLPHLRERIQSTPQLWRRFLLREELTGLTREEMPAFVKHHFGPEVLDQFPPESLRLVFERGLGVPGLLLPMLKVAQRSQDSMDPTLLDELTHYGPADDLLAASPRSSTLKPRLRTASSPRIRLDLLSCCSSHRSTATVKTQRADDQDTSHRS